uniref:Glucuronosyltransferase n=1 Tax=Meloidogyne hapla TaxID=6305 RepID=A0A1I8B8C4_MELHA
MNSSLEAVKYGKPLLCIPFMADQFYISKALELNGVAVILDKTNDYIDLEEKLPDGLPD